jgi:hypothetical protein
MRDRFGTRVALVADVAGADPIDARDFARTVAERIRPAVTEADVVIGEPEPLDGSTVRVVTLFGPGDMTPAAALDAAVAAAQPGSGGWSHVRTGDDDHLVWQWVAADRPAQGIVRLEIHAGPGLGIAPVSP